MNRIAHSAQLCCALRPTGYQHRIKHDRRHVAEGVVDRQLLAAGGTDRTKMRPYKPAHGACMGEILDDLLEGCGLNTIGYQNGNFARFNAAV